MLSLDFFRFAVDSIQVKRNCNDKNKKMQSRAHKANSSFLHHFLSFVTIGFALWLPSDCILQGKKPLFVVIRNIQEIQWRKQIQQVDIVVGSHLFLSLCNKASMYRGLDCLRMNERKKNLKRFTFDSCDARIVKRRKQETTECNNRPNNRNGSG